WKWGAVALALWGCHASDKPHARGLSGNVTPGSHSDASTDAGPRPKCLVQAVATYDFVRLVRRIDSTVWKAVGNEPFTRVQGQAGDLLADDIAASGSSAYSNAIGCAIDRGAVWCFPLAGPLTSAVDLGAGSAADPHVEIPQAVLTQIDTDAGTVSDAGAGIVGPALQNAVQLSGGMNGGGASFCAVSSDGKIWCWGFNQYGLLGHGDTRDAAAARLVISDATTPFNQAQEVRVGFGSTCARKADGTVWCWGDNSYGQLATDPATQDGSLTPLQIPLNQPAIRLGANPGNTQCAVLQDTTVQCWGRNEFGEAGGSKTKIWVGPTQVRRTARGEILSGVIDVAPDRGMKAMCANTSSDGLVCWGEAFTQDDRTTPIGQYATPIGAPHGGADEISAPFSAYGARDGSLVFINGIGQLVMGANALPATIQPPCN
ncbi:MAG TPA: hypothetical protein VL137_17555, partial [Polyangiaceae bacterium]|nr:hypothetical protein [Polyangiaceae bacterium]